MRTVSTGLFILCSRVGFSDSTRIIRFRSDRRGQLCTSKIHSLSKPFLLEGLSVVMGWVCWVSGKRRFHYVHKHRQKLALRGPGPKMRTSTWFQAQTFNAFNLQTLPTYKPSNSQTLKAFERHVSHTFYISKFENFKPLTPQSLKFFDLSNFEAFKLSKLPGFQTFNLQTLKLSNSSQRAAL